MSTLKKKDFERSMDMEIKKRVDDMFVRAFAIRRIRRKKRIKEWLGRHLN